MKKVCAVLSILLALVVLCSCGKADNFRYKRDVESFNTSSLLYIYDDFTKTSSVERFESVWSEVEKMMAEIEESVAVDIETSDVYRLNHAKCGERVSVSAVTADIFMKAKTAYEKSGGSYDPTVYPLVDLWGFSPRFSDDYEPKMPYDRKRSVDDSIPIPDEKYIEAFKSLVGFDKVELIAENGEYFIVKNIEAVVVDGSSYEAMLDFGGIAKGYAAEKALALLREKGYLEGYFSCGTSSIAFLESGAMSANDKCFALSIRKSRGTNESGNAYASVNVKNACVSSSGDYEKYYELDGVRYCHIIDTKTGRPINTTENTSEYIMSVTLIGDDAAVLDGLSTGVMTMTVKDAKNFLKRNGINAVVSYFKDGEYRVYTTLQKTDVEIKDENYVLD